MTLVREIMTADVVSVRPDVTLRTLVDLFVEKHITGAPVLAGNEVVGVISMDDVASFLSGSPPVPTMRQEDQDYEFEEEEDELEDVEAGNEPPGAFFADNWADAGAEVVERFAAPDTPEWDMLGEHTVAEAMSRSLLAVRPTTPVVEAAQLMKYARVHRLLVLEGRTLVGIVTTTDIAEAVADRRV